MISVLPLLLGGCIFHNDFTLVHKWKRHEDLFDRAVAAYQLGPEHPEELRTIEKELRAVGIERWGRIEYVSGIAFRVGRFGWDTVGYTYHPFPNIDGPLVELGDDSRFPWPWYKRIEGSWYLYQFPDH